MKTGMGGHQSSRMKNDEWLTPPQIIKDLGEFDLDPCSPINRPWPTANHHYTIEDDGLSLPWFGRVWMNPPYGIQAAKWLEKLANHGNGISLIFARTETEMFFRQVWQRADAILFFRGRLTFHKVDGNPAEFNGGAPSCLVAYGQQNVQALQASVIKGHLITSSRNQRKAV